MADAVRQALELALASGWCDIGEIRIRSEKNGFTFSHRLDAGRTDLQACESPGAVEALARFDDHGKYRPLKTAPNLAHGWALRLKTMEEVEQSLQSFYPGRLEVLVASAAGWLETTCLRQTLKRQTGMYRVAAKISDPQIDHVVGEFCRSDGGCLRTILWHKNDGGECASKDLPEQKFDMARNQVAAIDGKISPAENFLPLLCQEACNLLVNACRKVVQAEKAPRTCPNVP